jgi:hypothetical protein
VRLLKLLYLFICHLDLCLVIHFIGEDHDLDVGARVLFNLVEPDGDTLEAFPIGKVKYDDDAVGALVIGVSDGAIALLPSRVPNLQLDCRLVDLHRAEAEIHSNCANVILLETIVLPARKI